MGAIEARRTLVKSVPELWATLSEAEQLGPLLDGAFGEIRITRLEPESLIAWESELARGEVELTESGFGTRVRLTANLADAEPPPPEPTTGRLRRLLARLRGAPAPPPPPEPPPPQVEPDVAERALGALLDQVGAARHRPFSR
jgi:hypothetical protein